jgi:hypothetical protein
MSNDDKANASETLERRLRVRLDRLVSLKDYAVANGVDIDDDLIDDIASLQRMAEPGSLLDEGATIDKTVLRLCRITYPVTIENISVDVMGESPSYERFKLLLMLLGGVGVIAAVASAHFSFKGQYGTIFPQSIFALCLGFLGAVVYSFFSALRILPRTFGVDDKYLNYARLVLGSVLGWIVYFAFLQDTFQAAFGVGDPPLANDEPTKARMLLLSPFLVGYSTTLAVGILNKAITAVELTFGLEDRRDPILRSTGRKTAHAARGRLARRSVTELRPPADG